MTGSNDRTVYYYLIERMVNAHCLFFFPEDIVSLLEQCSRYSMLFLTCASCNKTFQEKFNYENENDFWQYHE